MHLKSELLEAYMCTGDNASSLVEIRHCDSEEFVNSFYVKYTIKRCSTTDVFCCWFQTVGLDVVLHSRAASRMWAFMSAAVLWRSDREPQMFFQHDATGKAQKQRIDKHWQIYRYWQVLTKYWQKIHFSTKTHLFQKGCVAFQRQKRLRPLVKP